MDEELRCADTFRPFKNPPLLRRVLFFWLYDTIYSMYEYNAKLDRVVDGDTVDAMIDLGFDTWVHKRIRLLGIDAPETRTRDLDEKVQGLATKKRLEDLLEAANGMFVLQSHGVGKYGRCLGTIIIEDENINELLIREGLAEVYK